MGCTKSQESVPLIPKASLTIAPSSTSPITETQITNNPKATKPILLNQLQKFLSSLISSSQKVHLQTLIKNSQQTQDLPTITPSECLEKTLTANSERKNPTDSENSNMKNPEKSNKDHIEFFSIPIISLSTQEIVLISKPLIRPLSIKEYKRSIKKSQTLPPSKLSSYIFKARPSVPVLSPLYGYIELNVKSETIDDFQIVVDEYNMKQAPNYFINPLDRLDNEESWPLAEILNFFDEILEKKFLEDQKILTKSEKPQEIFTFLIEFLENERKLKELLSSLNQYSTNTYIQVIKKLLGLEEKDISLNFSVFLCKVHQDFKILIKEKSKMQKDLQKFSTLKTSKTSKSQKKGKKPSKSSPDEAATLFSLFEYINKHFNSPLMLSVILKNLCPPTLQYEEYLLFYSIYKSRKIGCKISSLPIKDFFPSILNFIDFPITPDQQSNLMNYMNSKEKQELKQLLSFTTHKLNILKPQFSLKKSEFLLALIKSYEFVKDHSVFAIKKMVESERLDREMFYDEAFRCENGFCDEVVNKLFDEGTEIDKCDKVCKETFVKLMIKAGVAYLKFFQIDKFGTSSGKKKEVNDGEECL